MNAGAATMPVAPNVATQSLVDSIQQLVRSIEQLVLALQSAAPGAAGTPAVTAATEGGGGTGSSCCASMQATSGAGAIGQAPAAGANAAPAAPSPSAAPAESPRSATRSATTERSDDTRRTRQRSTSDAAPTGPAGEFDLKRKNPRSVAEMLEWVKAEVDDPDKDYYNRCGHFSAYAYGWSASGEHYAIDQWRNAPKENRHAGDTNPPAGALVFWETGSRAGHVAISMGNGMVASNDIRRRGKIDIVPLSEITSKWGADYQGWTPPELPKAA
jgi:hypothetical protein